MTNRSNTPIDINSHDRISDSPDKEITKLYKSTMDSVYMAQESKDNIRASLAEKSKKGNTKGKAIRICRYAAIAAAVCAVLLCIPATRTTVSAAIEYLKQTFHLANGPEVTYEQNSEGNSIKFSITTTDDNGYTKVENGRLYFVLGDTKEDITDKCGPDKYFRHEIKNEDGSHSVILIGGTPESCGWAELFFDQNGKYVFNNMNVADYKDPWLDTAMHAEGVDTGNPYLDDELATENADSADKNNTTASGSSSSAAVSEKTDSSADSDNTAVSDESDAAKDSDSVYSVEQSAPSKESSTSVQITSGDAESGNVTYIEK